MFRKVLLVAAVLFSFLFLLTCSEYNPVIEEINNNEIIPPAGMILIPSGGETFSMGSATGPDSEAPAHAVGFTKDFFMDTTEVTQKDYSDLMKATYTEYFDFTWSSGVGPDYPVYEVTWYDAVLYCNARSKRDGLDTVYTYDSIIGATVPGNGSNLSGLNADFFKIGYRLPTEAEWEFACRAGTTGKYFWGNVNPDDYVWNSYNSGGTPQPVGNSKPNGFKLYDMIGNLEEWCNDLWGYYTSGLQVDPVGPDSGYYRVVRGGCFKGPSTTSTDRNGWLPFTRNNEKGFRVVCIADSSIQRREESLGHNKNRH